LTDGIGGFDKAVSMKSAAVVLLSLVIVWPAHRADASGEYIGAIEEIWVNSQGAQDVGWIKSVGAIPSPSCGDAYWLKMDLTQPSMKLALAAAMTAQAAGRQVRLRGKGVCSGNYEFLEYVAIK
jgi:hypothetical protein